MEKCASSSIEKMLAPYSDILLARVPEIRHTNYRDYKKHFQPYLQENFA